VGELNTVRIELERVVLDERNPRTHDPKNLAAIRASLVEHGQVEPLILQASTMRLIAGHGRVSEMRALGWREAHAVLLDISDEMARKLAIRLNRSGELAGWNDEELTRQLLEIGFDGALDVGFDSADFGALLDEFGSADQVKAFHEHFGLVAGPAGGAGQGGEGAGSGANGQPEGPRPSLADRFVVPPFSILDARQGYWQKRKGEWLAIGIRSELGRGSVAAAGGGELHTIGGAPLPLDRLKRGAANAIPGGSRFPATRRGPDGEIVRGDSLGRPLTPRREADQASNVTGAPPLPEWATNGLENMAPGTSIFDPVLCEIAYRWFSPEGGTVLDPFAGGSVRGVVAALLGRSYIGVDLREEQVLANRAQWEQLRTSPAALPPGVEPEHAGASPRWVAGDSTRLDEVLPAEELVDLVFSCPPYGSLERYSDDPLDLSTMDLEGFREAYRRIIAQAVARLRPNRFAVFVVGDYRDAKGFYSLLPSETIAAFEAAGARLYNEAVLITTVGSLAIRVAVPFKSARKLGKTHQNVLVFFKGDPKRIAEEFGDVDVAVDHLGEGIEGEAAEEQEPPPAGMRRIRVSAKMARLPFNGCDPEYIKNVCRGACCRSSTQPEGTLISIHPDEVAAMEARGQRVVNGKLVTPARRCPFQNGDDHLCGIHFTPDKPFGCIASPFTLNGNDTLIVRNRYRLLKCFDDGQKIPAYRAFAASLRLVFGAEEAARITAHLDAGGDDVIAFMPEATARRMETLDAVKRAVKAGEKASPAGEESPPDGAAGQSEARPAARPPGRQAGVDAPAWAKGYELADLRRIAALFQAHEGPHPLGAFSRAKENAVAEWLASGQLDVVRDPSGEPIAAFMVSRSKSRRKIEDFSGRELGTVEPRSPLVQRVAWLGEAGRAAIEEGLRAALDAPDAWWELWQESAEERALATSLGFRWAGTKIRASSELRGLWRRRPAGSFPLGEDLRVADRAHLCALAIPPMLAEADALRRAVAERVSSWADHYSTYNLRHSWTAMALRGFSPSDPAFIVKPSEMSKAWKAEHPEALSWRLGDTALRAELPEAEPLIAAIPGKKERIRLMRLASGGGELARHSDIVDPDAGTRPGKLLRIHWPIQTSAAVVFDGWTEDGRKIARHFELGRAWYLDTRKPHTAANRGAVDRIHLVLDVESCPELLALLQPA
jgi:hypothetical protein